MKRVSDKVTWEVFFIDEKKEPNWQQDYNHWSGVPFEWSEPTPVEEMTTEELEEVVAEEENEEKKDNEELPLETLHDMYNALYGKEVPNRYKNDSEWIISKLA